MLWHAAQLLSMPCQLSDLPDHATLLQARRALGVSDLDIDRAVVSDVQAIEACQRLMNNAGSLYPPTGLAPLVQVRLLQVLHLIGAPSDQWTA